MPGVFEERTPESVKNAAIKDRVLARFRRWGELRPGDAAAGGPVRHVVPSRWPARAGNVMPLVALAPKYEPGHHEFYLDLLERALRQPDTRTVALTGSYGSGKSSVLRGLRRRYWDRRFPWWHRRVAIQLSLSTLDPDLAPAVQVENPAEREMSNRIQKELVKQLLYRLAPRKTPHSRFPRASRPSWLAGLMVTVAAAAVVALAWVVIELSGWRAAFLQRLDAVGWTPPWFWAGATAGLMVLALTIWRTSAGRYALSAGLKAGALTVSLEPTSSSYFDQYLDEIMYFFQVSKTNVVLIEDVDRFGDAVVFDTLRALHTLVNNSDQVGRRVVFVYAIRDSVLGEIDTKRKGGEDGEHPTKNPESEDPVKIVDRANRAKYFDVIIPIVPFVTADNARDLMMRVMDPLVADTPGKTGISPALIRLAARHLADMRTLWSIRNEFEVHADRLMRSASTKMPEINENIVLSLVLLRATSPDAYEKIRLTTSPLDTLTERWLELVDSNLSTLTKSLTDLRTQLENGQSRETRAERAGRQLDSLRTEFLPMAQGIDAAEVQFTGPVSEGNLADLGGWQQIADGSPLTLTLSPRAGRYPSAPVSVQVGSQMLSRLIGMPLDAHVWREADLEDLRNQIEATEKEITFLRHHTWAQLCARTDLTVPVAKTKQERAVMSSKPTPPKDADPKEPQEMTFADLVAAYAPTELAGGLIANGYLPRHFARYASMFYGKVLGVNAAEYIARAIEPGDPIIEYELNDESIGQILVEQKADEDAADLFDDVSVYNLDIVAYLIKHRPGAAGRVAAHLAKRWGEREQAFVGRFFQRKGHDTAAALAALMAPSWGQALRYTAVDLSVPPETRLRLVDAVMSVISSGERDDLDSDVANYLSEHYAKLHAVAEAPDEARAATVMATMAAAGATIRDLTQLRPFAMAAATQASIYPITAINLVALGAPDSVSLDAQRLQDQPRPVYDHLLANLADYLQVLTQLDPPGRPIADPAQFATILNDIANAPQATLLDQLVEASPASCRVTDLADTLPTTWPTLVRNGRTDPTFGNVQRYASEHGVDEALGEFLTSATAISTPQNTPQPERLALATTILAARESIPTPGTRVELATSTTPGVIPIEKIADKDANLIGPLLAAGLLADEPETFNANLLRQWEDFEAAVGVSRRFGEFADESTMPVHFLAPTLASASVPDKTKSALIGNITELLDGATEANATAIAQALAERRAALDLVRIEALREAGASTGSLVRLLVSQGDDLPLSDLRTVLLAMPGDYARVSAGGNGTIRFDVDDDHRTLLQCLDGTTHTGAKVVSTKKYGTKLEANLRRPPS